MTKVSVANPLADYETSFHDLLFNHIGCGPMHSKRDLISSDYTLTCGCGLEILVLRDGPAYTAILDAVTDEQPRELPDAGYKANIADPVVVVPNGAA